MTTAGISAFSRFKGYVFPMLGAFSTISRPFLEGATAAYVAGVSSDVEVDETYIDDDVGGTAPKGHADGGNGQPGEPWTGQDYEDFTTASVIPRIIEFFDLDL